MRILALRNSLISMRTNRMKTLNITANCRKSRLERRRVLGAAALVVLWAAVFVSCGNNSSNISSMRLMDRFSSQNIVVSPMQDLVKKFISAEEDLDDRWRFVPSLSSSQQKVWGASSRNPVMGHPDSPERDDIHLYYKGEEIPYRGTRPQSQRSWQWIRTSESFDLKQQPAFNRKAQGIVLKQGQSVRFEKLLPDQEVLLELYIVNSHWVSYRPKLEVLLDDGVIEEITVSRQRWFRFRFTPELGLHEIKVRFPETEGSKEDQFVLIGRAQMECPAEIVLLSLARTPADPTPGSGYAFRYHRNDILDEGSQGEDLGHLLHLYYNYRHTSLPEDAGKGENRHNVKQKLLLGDTSYNVLLAPAHSEFSIPLKIPSRAQLECGMGFVDLVGRNPSKPVFRFSIKIKFDKQEDLLLQKEAEAGIYGDGVIWEKLDLSAYAGKNVQLAFITDNLEAVESPQGVPYWVNPVVFSPTEEAPANIVLISLDTVRPDYLGCYGHDKDTSPALDAFAQDSALFLNCFSTSSWTLPAHVSLLTGQNSKRHQVYYPYEKFDSSALTMADHLRQQGYTTAAFTGGGYLSSQFGFAKGFDRYQELLLHGENAIRWDEAERLADMANAWIKKNREKKFFLFLHTYQPHDHYANLSSQGKKFLKESAPWDQVNMEDLLQETGRFQTAFSDAEKRNIRALYEGEIHYTDQMFVKPVLDSLKQNGLYANTLVIILSDHGEEFYDHESWLHDHSLYNEAIRIPLIIKFPQARYSGNRLDELTCITDIVPTALEFAGVPRSGLEIDGNSLIPILQYGQKGSDRSVFSHLALRSSQEPPSVVSLIRGNLKIIVHRDIESPYIESKSHKFGEYQVELYDRAVDPQETNNLAKESAFRTTCTQLVREIHDLIQETAARRTQKETVVLDATLEERLKALGYIK